MADTESEANVKALTRTSGYPVSKSRRGVEMATRAARAGNQRGKSNGVHDPAATLSGSGRTLVGALEFHSCFRTSRP